MLPKLKLQVGSTFTAFTTSSFHLPVFTVFRNIERETKEYVKPKHWYIVAKILLKDAKIRKIFSTELQYVCSKYLTKVLMTLNYYIVP